MNFMEILTGWFTGQVSFVALLLWIVQQIMAAQ